MLNNKLKIDSSIRAKHTGMKRTKDKIKYLVFHYTGNSGSTATAKGNANYFSRCERPASAHYVVDEKNTIYNAVPDLVTAYAVGDKGKGRLKNVVLNFNSIHIEMVSKSKTKNPVFDTDDYYIPEKTLSNAIALGVYLMKKFSIPIENVIRHGDVTNKRCPEPFYGTPKKDKEWAKFKERLIKEYNNEEGDDEVIQKIKMDLLGNPIEVDGIFKENRNFVSVKVFSNMGLNVKSNNKAEPIISTDAKTMSVNGVDKQIKCFNAMGTNYASIRDIAEALGAKVDWDSENKKIIITK